MQRAIGRLRAGGSGFNPASLFGGGAAGIWLDPSDISTGYQESTGSTAQSAASQPTGLRLDKRFGATAGTDLAAGKSFTTASANTSCGGLQTTFTGASSGAISEASTMGMTPGVTYEVFYVITGYTQGGVNLIYGGGVTGPVRSANGVYIERIRCSPGTTLFVQATGTPTTLALTVSTVKPILGNHVLQASAAARPTYDVVSGIQSDFFDGADDLYSTAAFSAGTLTSDMDAFVAVNISGTAGVLFFEAVGVSWAGLYQSGGTSSSISGGGSAWTIFVNGTQVGVAQSVTDGQLYTAITGGWRVVELRNLDLSAVTALKSGLYSGSWVSNHDIGGLILCPAQTDSKRAQIRTWLGRKVGLSL